jgi:uncharacterized protein (TIGR03083 family)
VASFREQQVRFPFDDDAARVNRVLRERQLDVVRGVPLDEWARPSRCTGWSVHDVVRHVVQMNEAVVGVVAATRAGERYERMRRFDPKTTPSAWLAEAPAAEPEETLASFERSTRAVIDVGDALGGDVLVGSPAGLQPWPRVVLHALLDAVVHERDVTEPLGRSAPPAPELLPALAYVLLLAARVASSVDRELAVQLDLGGHVLGVAVRGTVVEVVPVGRNGELGPTKVATRGDFGGDAVVADPLRLIDGLTGRVPLDEVLPAPDDVRAALGLLAPSL